jgi:protein-disulfide isomerase
MKIEGRTETVLSMLLTAAALVLAATVVYGQFFAAKGDKRTKEEIVYVSDWREIKQVGVTTGPPQPAVQLVEFSDFQCPYCRASHAAITALLKQHPQQISYTLVHYPLSSHPYAAEAARSAECARRQGRFAAMSEALFALQDSIGKRDWARYAIEAAVADTSKFSLCMQDPESARAQVEAGRVAGGRVEVKGTPTMIINGWLFKSGGPAAPQLHKTVQEILSGKSKYKLR